MASGLRSAEASWGLWACGISTSAAEASTLAIRDFYPYWRDRGEVASAGKLLMVDSQLSTARHDIFFDDNIRYAPLALGGSCCRLERSTSGPPTGTRKKSSRREGAKQ